MAQIILERQKSVWNKRLYKRLWKSDIHPTKLLGPAQVYIARYPLIPPTAYQYSRALKTCYLGFTSFQHYFSHTWQATKHTKQNQSLKSLPGLIKHLNKPQMSRLTTKTNKMICAPRKDSDQPKDLSFYSCKQRRLWSDWVDAQADLSLRWVHRTFCWFCHEAAQMVLCSDPAVIMSKTSYAQPDLLPILKWC